MAEQLLGTLRADDGTEFSVTVLSPNIQPLGILSLDDVLGVAPDWEGLIAAGDIVHFDPLATARMGPNMVAARQGDICPIWGDEVPYKSMTVVGPIEVAQDIGYWMEFVQGCGAISRTKILGNGKIALRADYMAW